MSKVELNSKFDNNYSLNLNNEIKQVIESFDKYFESLQYINSQILSHILQLKDMSDKMSDITSTSTLTDNEDQTANKKPLDLVSISQALLSSSEKQLKLAHEIYNHRLTLINWIKTCLYFCEMRMMPFTLDSGNKITTIINSIISLSNTHLHFSL